MKKEETRPNSNGRTTAHLDERPILDRMALQNLGLTDDQADEVLRGASCVSEQELRARWPLLGGCRDGDLDSTYVPSKTGRDTADSAVLAEKAVALAQECGGIEQLRRLVDRLAGLEAGS